MDGLENLNIQGIVEVVATRKKIRKVKKSSSKIFTHLLLCLNAGKHRHMLKFLNKEKTKFEVTFINKKSRNWDRRHISLFEELDGVFENRKRSEKKYEEDTKTRFRSNMKKLNKYIKRVTSDKEVDNRTIKKEVYEIIYPEYLAELRSKNINVELNDMNIINGNRNDIITSSVMENITNVFECTDPNINVISGNGCMMENIPNVLMNEDGSGNFDLFTESTKHLNMQYTYGLNMYEENTNALNKHTVITGAFYNDGDENLNIKDNMKDDENSNFEALIAKNPLNADVDITKSNFEEEIFDADVSITENIYEKEISNADVSITENIYEKEISNADVSVTENIYEVDISDSSFVEFLRNMESDSNEPWLTEFNKIQ